MRKLAQKEKNNNKGKLWMKITFFLLGIASTIWFLIRVIPKPSRATYPCMRTAAPLMSSFVIYLLSIAGSAFAFRNFKKSIAATRYIAASAFFIVALVMLMAANLSNTREAKAINLLEAEHFEANNPIGDAQGLFPGRVVWVWNKHATDENYNPPSNSRDKTMWWAYFTNGEEVEKMLEQAILNYSGESELDEAWDVLFRYFNNQRDKGDVGYKPGEKVYIKLNITNSASGEDKTSNFNRMDSTPELALALLKHLVEIVGVNQSDIYIGDPFRTFHSLYWDMCHDVYPDVNYTCGRVLNGRHQTVPTSEPVMHFSDGQYSWRIPQEYVDAEYFINMPCLKTHNEGGITLGAKNHQGSVLQDGAGPADQYAINMHYSLPANNPGYGKYRHIVDYLSHKDVGGKTLITIIDGIWAGRSWEGYIDKWNMAPFNGDYPSSLFVSQDRVAVDAVCYDFLLEEYKDKNASIRYPYFEGCDDYLFQAADASYWPEGLVYDPEGDGTPISSLGVYEHWNNPLDKLYSRDLGTGDGIELVKVNLNNDPLTSQNSGLASSKVKKIVIDKHGVKWFGTDKGISRFDGTNWETIDNTNNLRDNNINDLFYDRTFDDDNLWVATNGGVSALKINANGVVSSENYYVGSPGSEILSNEVDAVGVDANNNCWIATTDGLNVFDGENWDAIFTFMNADRETESWNSLRVNDIASYENDAMVYVATAGKGVFRYGYNDVDGFTSASAMTSRWSGFWSDSINSIRMVDTIQWYGTTRGTFQHLGPSTKNYWDFAFTEYEGIVDPVVNDVEVDGQGNIWMGTNNGIHILSSDGIFKYSSGIQTSQIKASPGSETVKLTWTNGNGFPETIFSSKINDIATDMNGDVLVASDNGVEIFKEVPGVSHDLEARRVVFITKNEASDYPAVQAGMSYNGSSEFPGGSKIGQWVCVYNGTGNSVNVTGLSPETNYRAIAFEYMGNEGKEVYCLLEGPGNPVAFSTNPSGTEGFINGSFQVYPVPFTDNLTIERPSIGNGFAATFYTSDGRVCLHVPLKTQKQIVNTSTLKSGIYFLEISNGEVTETVTILK
ncbi:MAG: DUF362 domain-containing protein [Prolixibacteraceae bacterium]|nr:DUF362 domain-containing protein [Prolixibacteraceae bacterium]